MGKLLTKKEKVNTNLKSITRLSIQNQKSFPYKIGSWSGRLTLSPSGLHGAPAIITSLNKPNSGKW
ncbi:hypothetical protein J2X69_003107 [Algoriphagus sp. 4150]|nr:hypothetical protein [Algoriphagus sp. 4150]